MSIYDGTKLLKPFEEWKHPMIDQAKPNTPEFTLDNAAKAWPPVVSKGYSSRFRLSAILSTPVDAHQILIASKILSKRFPWFTFKIRAGFFWYYLYKDSVDPIPILPGFSPPCVIPHGFQPLTQPLVSIHCYGHNLSVEASHIVTDGAGLKSFFRCLLVTYGTLVESKEQIANPPSDLFAQVINSINDLGTILSPLDPPSHEEWRDDYIYHHLTKLPKPRKPTPALHLPVPALAPGHHKVIHGLTPLQPILSLAKSHKVKLGEYLSAIVLYGLQQCILELPDKPRKKLIRKPLRLLLPVDLRSHVRSDTMRNFLAGITIEIDLRLGTYSFEELLHRVHHVQQAELDKKFLHQQVSRNVQGEQSTFIRLVPLALKNLVLRHVFIRLGDMTHTASFSNLGTIELPKFVHKFVSWVGFTPPPGQVCRMNVTAISFKDTLCLTVGKTTRYSRLEYFIFQFLKNQNLEIQLYGAG
jgi:hypothetical protein